MNEIWGPSNQQVLNSLLVLVGKTYQENQIKTGSLLGLSSAVTFTLRFWSYDDIYMLNRIEKNWQVVWREGNCNYETAPDALEM